MADKKSGVYYYLTDNSIRPGGGSGFGGIVPMYTVKGPVGELIPVTAQDCRQRLGYDIEYNKDYLGLESMLSHVARLNVLRMNFDTKIGWAAWDTGGPILPGDTAYNDFDELSLAGHKVWVAHKSPGDWGNFFVRFEDIGNGWYRLDYAEKKGNVYKLVKSYTFSLDPEAKDYYEKVKFGDLALGFERGDEQNPVAAAFPASFPFYAPSGDPEAEAPHEYAQLKNGSYGVKGTDGTGSGAKLAAGDLLQKFPVIDKIPCDHVMVLNGLTADTAIVKKIIDYCAKQDRSVFIDVADMECEADPSISGVDETIGWVQSGNFASDVGQYGQLIAGRDLVELGPEEYDIPPSVYLFQAYAKMFANFGSTNYPPAGFLYSSVSVGKLKDTNFGLDGDGLKTNRVNYLTSGSRGVCIWEQRTLYSEPGSDLSYANTVFILRDLKIRILNFMEGFTFRYTTPVDLLNIQSGLSTILSYFKDNFFLVNYALKVPTYEEAQAAGRELDIDIKVSVINDAEVINIRVGLENAANLRAA